MKKEEKGEKEEKKKRRKIKRSLHWKTDKED